MTGTKPWRGCFHPGRHLAPPGPILGFPDSSVGKESAYNARDPGLIPGLGRSIEEGIGYPLQYSWASLEAQLVKKPPGMQETWVGKIPWRRERLLTPVLWPGEFHGLYSAWDHKELDTTERLSLYKCFTIPTYFIDSAIFYQPIKKPSLLQVKFIYTWVHFWTLYSVFFIFVYTRISTQAF